MEPESSTVTPRIAIPVPTSGDFAYNDRSWFIYADAVSRSGGQAVRLELAAPASELRALIASCQGVCLPGSPADVQPSRYAADTDPATSPADLPRETVDNLLLEDAYAHGKPVLGICFGVQSLNVWRGGTLMQDLEPLPVNHAAGGQVAVAHTVLIPRSSLLASLMSVDEAPERGGFMRLPINSSHHQAIGVPGDGLRVVARCTDDDVIEAIEAPFGEPGAPAFVLGVQWHPERSYDISSASRALFTRLIEEAAKITAPKREAEALPA